MKRHRVWAELSAPENLWRAWCEYQRGKRRREDVATFALHAESQVLALARGVATGTWRPGKHRILRISDPKRRIIAAAPVADRVVHHALHRVLAPRLNRRFIDHSYACLEGRGVQRALLAVQAAMQRSHWRLHLDVRRYFYSIDRAVLQGLLWRCLPEPQLRGLLHHVLHCSDGLYRRADVVQWLGWSGPLPAGRGLPIGDLTSQWWGNLYLDGLDHFVLRELRPTAWLRYMDDFVVFGPTRGALEAHRAEIAGWLAHHRGLELKEPDAQPVLSTRPFHVLGHRITRERISLGPKARARMHRRLRQHINAPARLEQAVGSYAALWMWGS